MPRKNIAGTFQNGRWSRMVNGERYHVVCRGLREGEEPKPNYGYLNLPESQHTKGGSQAAANAWWEAKEAELASHPPAHLTKAIEDRANMLQWLDHERPDDPLADTLRSEIADIQKTGKVPAVPATFRRVPKGYEMLPLPHPEGPQDWQERIETVKKHNEWSGKAAVDPDKRVSAVVVRYLNLQRAAVAARSGGSPATVDNIRRNLEKFVTHLGPEASVEVINARFWEGWFVWVSAQTQWSQPYRRDLLVASRSFVEWCWKQELIETLPRNLSDGKISVDDPGHIETFTDDEIRRLLAGTKNQLRLHMLLMLNCGFTQMDIATLKHDEVDTKRGVIIRKRSKTRGKKTVPVVTYKLWKITLDEMKNWKSRHPTLALTSNKGTPWIRQELKDDANLSKTDLIRYNFRDLAKKLEIPKSLKVFRKTSADRLAKHPQYRSLRGLFLGHANKEIADRHYAGTPEALLTEAIEWLGSQYGF